MRKAPSNEKIDLFKLHKADYAAPKGKPVIVDVAEANYLTIRGSGAPGESAFEAAVGGLYSTAYTMKFISKAAGQDYVVCKLEAQYWTRGASPSEPMTSHDPADFEWKMLIRVPGFVTPSLLEETHATIRVKGGCAPEAADVMLEAVTIGRCVQMLHIGPYEQEHETLQQMSDFAAEQNIGLIGPHHEIYLSDPRRVAPEKLKTILRHPIGP